MLDGVERMCEIITDQSLNKATKVERKGSTVVS